MGLEFTGVLIALFKLFSLMLAGYLLNKKNILTADVNKAFTWLVVNLTNPALVLGSLSSTGAVSQGDVFTLFLFGIGFYLMLPLFAFPLVKLLRIHKSKQGMAQMLLVFANTGFMAIPIFQALYGDVSIFYSNILNIPFNFLIYTYGLYLITKDDPSGAPTSTGIEPEGQALTAEAAPAKRKLSPFLFITPGIISSIIALAMFFLKIRFPLVLEETFSFVGNLTPPLSMLVLGAVLGEYPLSNLFSDLKINGALLFKMFLFPVLSLLFAKLFFTNSVIIGIIVLTCAMPSGTMCVMLSKTYHGNTATASSGVVFSTIASLLTIPLVYLILGRFF